MNLDTNQLTNERRKNLLLKLVDRKHHRYPCYHPAGCYGCYVFGRLQQQLRGKLRSNLVLQVETYLGKLHN